MADKSVDNDIEKPAEINKQARSKVPAKQGWKLFFGVLGLLVWVGVSVIVSQIVVGRVMVWILGVETILQPVPMALYSAFSYLLAMVLVIFVPPRVSVGWKIVNSKGKEIKGKKEPKEAGRELLGLKGWPTWTDIGLAPVGFIVYILLAAVVTALFTWMNTAGIFPWFEAEQAQELGFSAGLVGMDRVVAFITLVVVAPIAEEIIFRGWLYGKLRAKFSGAVSEVAGMILSILLVSVLFGIVHMQWNVGVNVFALSVVLCGLREFTGTIYSGIILHMIKNGFAFYLLYVAGIG